MVRVAVVGCAHGLLDDIYATIQYINEMDPSRPIQLLLCCGDFECMRNSKDLATLACPPKYRAMHAFHRYYSQAKRAPVLTVFVGGNHEASNYLHELHYGGWVAPNMFYLGAAGVIRVGGLRIGGISGIYKQQDYTAGHYETMPYDNGTMRSIYHVRELEVYQLSHVQQQDKHKLNAFLSHDWPRGIEQYGDVQRLLRVKPFFQQEVQSNSLGSPAGEFLLFQLRPEHWFAAHLHVKFAAVVRHQQSAASTEKPSEDTNEGNDAPPQQEMTKFLALDKCLPKRDFLQVLDIPGDSEPVDDELKVMFDLEWLAILRATHHLASASKYAPRVPAEEMKIDASDIEWVRTRLTEFMTEKSITHKVEGEWLTDFVMTAPPHGQEASWSGIHGDGNPQTDMLLELLKLPHVFTSPFTGTAPIQAVADPNEIEIDDEDDNTKECNDNPSTTEQVVEAEDPNAIDLDDDLIYPENRGLCWAVVIMRSWVREASRRARMPSLGLPRIEYDVRFDRLDPALQRAWVQLDCDEETQTFLDSCTGGTMMESFASTVLGAFYSLTDVNGMLGRGQMFVLSKAQIQTLLHREQRVGDSLLDIGAGDGNVTASLASLVDRVTTTEVSAPMVRSLNQRGYNAIETCDLAHPNVQAQQPFEIISMLNVLDRADKPMTMLHQIREMLNPETGLFLLAVVLPFSAFVEVGTQRVAPSERLPMQGGLCANGDSFEAAASVLLRNVLQPAGFQLLQFSRVPYLCRGDMRQPYYVLSDAIFVLKVDPAFVKPPATST
ncbi:TPA: hypothetical protein N0F65_010129 [Lagenidium giganteum]|uniref:Lariat debranching enzyme C-terminal domain-containing protein n=1 Tax=Lagenidium giganteum TaxID=4803 RepID=A0AAV2Z6P7_9STRA|nr:TPA: hypothetical protein N0F65_010129 [Lagenidium giganteum]